MRVVVQRVSGASVRVDGRVVSRIGPGLLCLVGLKVGDADADAEFLARKVLNMRVWPTESKAWDLSVSQKAYEILCVSQFTLYGRLNGNKPDYSKAMPPSLAGEAYAAFVQRLGRAYAPERVKDGVFGAMMEVELVNDGPVTFVLDSDRSAAADDAAAELPLDAL